MSGEFEDREQETLGELPQPIAGERHEIYPPSAPRIPPHGGMVNMQPGALPIDVAQQGQKLRESEGDNSRLGSPVIPASVTSVYDARPINGRDFRVIAYPTVTLPLGEATATLSATYTVPEGYVTVLRRFLWQSVIPVAAADGDLVDGGYLTYFPRISIFVDNVAVSDYSDLYYDVNGMTQEDETFVLAQAGQIIKVQGVITQDYASLFTAGGIAGATPFRVAMYGQNLLTRGMPLPFEIATQIKTGIQKG